MPLLPLSWPLWMLTPARVCILPANVVNCLYQQPREHEMTATLTAPTATTYNGKSAQEYRDMASARHQASRDSFERSDTDGFLSQWASDSMGRKYSLCANLAETDGLWEVSALFNLDGTLASTHEYSGQYGMCWVLNDESAARFGKRFVNQPTARKAARRASTYAAKGFTVGSVVVAAHVETVGGGRGLGSLMSVRDIIAPNVDDLRAGRFYIVASTGGDDTDY